MKKRIAFTCYVNIVVEEDHESLQDYEDIDSLVDDLVTYKFNPNFPPIASGAVEIDELFFDDIDEEE